MRFAIVNPNGIDINKTLKKEGIKIVKKNPDFVICVGGDGTILLSERLYPSIPKLATKASKICEKCEYTPSQLKAALKLIKEGKYKIKEEKKLEAKFKNKKLVALNEIQIHNKDPSVALRFSLHVNGKVYRNLIGDGVIIATPYGATGYYKSAGGKKFKSGIGIVLNNLHSEGKKNVIVNENSKIVVKVEREEAWLIRDNDKNFIKLKPGDKVYINLSKEKAKFLSFNS